VISLREDFDMDDSKSGKEQKVTMDSDVFSSLGRHDDDIHIPEGLRRPGGAEERKALKTIFDNRSKFKLIRLSGVPEEETRHLSGLVRIYNNTNDSESPEIIHKMEELSNIFEDEKLGPPEFKLVAEAEDAEINIILTFYPTLIEMGKKLRGKGIVKVEIMWPSEYVDYLKN
jgi:hypothetical protein